MSIPLPDQPSGGRSQFPPIGDYGFLSDCETTALVAPHGGIESAQRQPTTGSTGWTAAGEEGTFTICSFWLVSALVQIGELARARALCEKLLSYASPPQLYAEEIDPRTGRQLGNFPQAFTHLALITAVTAVIRAERAQPR